MHLCNTKSSYTVKLLLNAGADIDVQKNNGLSALMIASSSSHKTGHISIVKLLIKAGANLNLKDADGNTALMLAIIELKFSNNIETVDLLIESGSDLNCQNNKGLTPLMLAIKYNDDIAFKLIKLGVKLDLQDEYGHTALIIAIKHHCFSIIKNLIEAKADVNILDHNGHNALYYTNDGPTIQLLIESGSKYKQIILNQNNIKYYTNAIININYIKNYKQFTYRFVLKQIPYHRNVIRYHPDNMGFKICQSRFKNINYDNLDQDIINYLNITNENDLSKISSFLND